MTALTDAGFVRTRLDERLAQLEEKIRGIYGADIDLSPDSQDGQLIGVFAEAISNLDQLAEDVYHSFNPQSATKAALSRLIQLNGIRRKEGSYSTAVVTVTGQFNAIIPKDSLIKNTSTGEIFATMVEGIIPESGTLDIPVIAQRKGAVTAGVGTLTKIMTPRYEWQSVTNAAPATLGRDEEPDERARIRRKKSTATPGQGPLDSLYGALADITGVIQAVALENKLDTPDANGLPPHSVYCIVRGGDDQAILDTIWSRAGQGVTLVGATSGIAIDSQGHPHEVNFGRPQLVEIYVVINLETRTGWPTDGEAKLKEALVNWADENQEIGEEVIHSRLFDALNTIPGHSIDDLFIGIAAAPNSSANVAIPFDSLASFDVTRIEVNLP